MAIKKTPKDLTVFAERRKANEITSFTIELTTRCNFSCRHCYVCVPPGDKSAQERELTLDELSVIVKDTAKRGALWCLVTGGEPLLRPDFKEVYLMLKKQGLLVTLFTNASLITEEWAQFFQKYPPNVIEITIYAMSADAHYKLTGLEGAFGAVKNGLDILDKYGVKYRLKAMALNSNIHEFGEISDFGGRNTMDFYRFDPQLCLRMDKDPIRNELIKSERLSIDKILEIEAEDLSRSKKLREQCDEIDALPKVEAGESRRVFRCGAGSYSFIVGADGYLRLCSSLYAEDCIYDIRKGTIDDFWDNFVPTVRNKRSSRKEFLEKCALCPLINLCMWCPAHAHLEVGSLDMYSERFCEIAEARYEANRRK